MSKRLLIAALDSPTRYEISPHHEVTVSRSASLSTLSVLCGSSTTIISPPNPNNDSPTEVASREPRALLSN